MRPRASAATNLNSLQLTTRDFVCKACSNLCDIKEFNIEGQKSYWGDKCSDKFRKPSPTGRKPVIEDLFALREKWLAEIDATTVKGGFKIGLPAAMATFERYPFWHKYFSELGFECVLSPPTDPRISAKGVDLARRRSPATRCRWPTATCTRSSRRASITSWSQHPQRRGGGRHPPRNTARGTRPCPSCCVRAPGHRGAPRQVPRAHPALSVWARLYEAGARGDGATPRCPPPRERPRRGCGLRRPARVQPPLMEAGAAALARLDETGEPGLILVGPRL